MFTAIVLPRLKLMQTHPVMLQTTHYNIYNTVRHPRHALVGGGMQVIERNNGLLCSYQYTSPRYEVPVQLMSLCVHEYVPYTFMMMQLHPL